MGSILLSPCLMILMPPRTPQTPKSRKWLKKQLKKNFGGSGLRAPPTRLKKSPKSDFLVLFSYFLTQMSCRFALGVVIRNANRGQKNRTRKKNKFLGTEVPRVPLILPIFSVFSVGGGPKVPRNFVPGNFFFLILGGFSPSERIVVIRNANRFAE